MEIYSTNKNIVVQIILDEVERARYECEGEVRRLESILLQLGVGDRFLSGPSSVYAQVGVEDRFLSGPNSIYSRSRK